MSLSANGPEARETLMLSLEEAFERDDNEKALTLSNELISLFPDDTECLCMHAAALSMADELDEALEFCGKALDTHPDALDLIQTAVELLLQLSEESPEALEEAADRLEHGCEVGEERLAQLSAASDGSEAALEAIEALKEGLSALYLLATDAFRLLDEPHRSLAAAQRAQALFPEDPDLRACLASALFELCRFDEARAELEAVLRETPDNAWAMFNYAILLDHLGRSEEADALILKAHALDPEVCPAQQKMSAKSFEKVVERAMKALPDKVRDYLGNVAIIVEALPAAEELLQSEPPLSPNCLGMFRGTPGPQQSVSDPWSTFPSAIVLFQRNLERSARDRDELVTEIGITLLHEVGHFLGLDEDDVAALGLA
ncbi:MAG: metallopeptidase family protein [Myxococcales bacterium]|jgi:predicted Zn-dependent protease with MMP-like domain/Flp pilus assembly protein TadD|nr:metallopeptidase family protein [Myxococcales bacterium]